MSFHLPLIACAIVALAPSLTRAQEPVPAEVIAEFQARPGNPAVAPDGRILLSVHPLDHPDVRIVELLSDGRTRPYPNTTLVSGASADIQAVIAIRIAHDGTAWILDLGRKRLTSWDMGSEQVARTFDIPNAALMPASFLQDFALDQKRNRVVIADMTQADLTSAPRPAFIVIDLATGNMRRVAQDHPALMPETAGGLALNGITIDPGYDWVYFGAVHGRTVYRVPAAAFDGDGERVAGAIEAFAPKPFSDGITVDEAQNIYITDIEHHAIGVSTPSGYRVLATLGKDQSWPDGFSFGPDGYVYATVNQLDRSATLNGGHDTGRRPFQLVRIRALAAGAIGR